ncbi:MAG: metallophosphoesterase [Tannerella sp.]|jgi:predicted MPP superfamily phosphohydrolase|nr:metallophosphoesterase [Tannerella sp.]
MVVFIILTLVAWLGGNGYICLRGWQALRHFPPVVKWGFGGLAGISALAILLIFVLRNSRMSASPWAHFLFQYATGWLVFTLYMVLFLLCCDLFRLLCHSFQYGFFCALTLTACLLIYGFLHYQRPSVQVLNLTVNKPVTGADDTCRIVAVSDLHLGMGTARGQLEKYVRMINGQQPDLILIGGDLIDNSIVPVRERRMESTLSQLRAKLGIYMVPGNHEYISGMADCAAFLRRTPIRLLRDSVVTLPNGIRIVGRDDRSNRLRKPLSQLVGDIDAASPVIVLDHQPVEPAQAVDADADLLFCGHTHHGQVWPMNLLTNRLFEIAYGYEKRGNTNIYVSSGLALWGPPFRIGTRSEMVVFNLSFRHP